MSGRCSRGGRRTSTLRAATPCKVAVAGADDLDRDALAEVAGGHRREDTHGLPFFAAGDRADAEVRLLLPAQDGADAEALLARAFGPPHVPIRPSQLQGSWAFEPPEAGQHAMGGFSVMALDVPHGGGRTFGFRVSDGRASVACLSDHSPVRLGEGPDGLGEYHEAALRLADGVDVLVHDAQLTAGEFAAKARYGHSAVEYPAGLAAAAGAERLVLFHHDPGRTDDQVDALLPGLFGGPAPVIAAVEGMVLACRTDAATGSSVGTPNRRERVRSVWPPRPTPAGRCGRRRPR